MEHLTLKAVTTTTDQGTFEAVISAASIDREKDIVDPAGMVRALSKWVPTGKKIPLAWNHSTAAEDIIGSVDPNSAKAVNDEVVVDGVIDQSTPRGAEAWRLVKSGVLGFSFGYLTLASTKRKGGGRHITELDVFEITATPTPMNGDTRVLSFKAAMNMGDLADQLVHIADQMESDSPPAMQDAASMLRQMADQCSQMGKSAESDLSPSSKVDETDGSQKARSVDPLRAKADALILEIASDGESLCKPPQKKEAPKRQPEELAQLRERARELTLMALTGETES